MSLQAAVGAFCTLFARPRCISCVGFGIIMKRHQALAKAASGIYVHPVQDRCCPMFGAYRYPASCFFVHLHVRSLFRTSVGSPWHETGHIRISCRTDLSTKYMVHTRPAILNGPLVFFVCLFRSGQKFSSIDMSCGRSFLSPQKIPPSTRLCRALF